MKKKQKRQIKNATITALKVLGFTGVVASVIVFPGLVYVVNAIDKQLQDRDRSRRAYYNLKSQGLIRTTKTKQGKVQIVLTEKGKKRVLRSKRIELKFEKPNSWDGKWRMVMFDIPEPNRSGRDLIRSQLYKFGFLRIQKSVFIFPYDCQDLIESLRGYFKLSEGELYIFETKVIEGEKKLLKYFNLQKNINNI